MELNNTPGEESLAGPPAQPTRKLRPWVWGIVVGMILLVGGGYAAVKLFSPKTLVSRTGPGPTQPTVSSSEQSTIGNGPVASLNSQLDVTALSAQNADLQQLLAKALQVSGNTTVQGNVTVSGNGSYGGVLQAANFSGSGAGLSGVDAALLNGKLGSYYAGLASNLGNAAQLGSANTFLAANDFSAGITSAGITYSGALSVNGPANLAGSTTIASLILSSPLTVPNGGTGLTTVPAAGVQVSDLFA